MPGPISNETLTTYFEGEKNAGLVLGGIGLAKILGAAILSPARFELRSFAITLGIFGLLEVAIGFGLYVKTGPQVARLLSQLASDAAAFCAAERPRMAVVQKNFIVLESIWLTLIPISAFVAVWQKRNPTISGIALALLVNVAIVLAFDVIAERRGSLYEAALSSC